MIRIAICDNDISVVGRTEELIMLISDQNNLNIEVEIYSDGFHLINDIIRLEIHFDLILLNDELKENEGLAIARLIRKIDKEALLIFMSVNEQNIKDFFQVQAFDFLLKPIKKVVLEQVLMRAYDEVCSKSFYFEYKYKGAYNKVPIHDILYFQSNKRIITIVTSIDSHDFYGKLSTIENFLSKTNVDFWRIHCSYLINSQYIQKLNYKSVVMKTNEILNISGNRRKEIREKYSNRLDEITWIA